LVGGAPFFLTHKKKKNPPTKFHWKQSEIVKSLEEEVANWRCCCCVLATHDNHTHPLLVIISPSIVGFGHAGLCQPGFFYDQTTILIFFDNARRFFIVNPLGPFDR
jgi:hypothetical protein